MNQGLPMGDEIVWETQSIFSFLFWRKIPRSCETC